MFSQTFKNIDNALREEAECSSELDYTEQSSWILFLKYLDDLEKEREEEALLRGEPYTPLIEAPYRWTLWAVPKKDDGSLDWDSFVNEELEQNKLPDLLRLKYGGIPDATRQLNAPILSIQHAFTHFQQLLFEGNSFYSNITPIIPY